MKNKIYYIVPLIVLFMVGSCKKSGLATYNGKPTLYFDYSPAGYTTDSIQISFAFTEDKQLDSTIKIPIRLMGIPLTKATPVDIKFTGGPVPAISDRDYKLNYNNSFPANVSTDTLTIKFLKTPTLLTKQLELNLEIRPTADLPDLYATTSTKSNKLRLFIDNILVPPPGWVNSSAPTTAGEYFFGTFTRKKLLLTLRLYRIGTVNDLYKQIVPFRLFFGNLLNAHLKAQRAAGNIILEDDGSEMKMGPYY